MAFEPEYPQSRDELWLNEIAGHLFDTEPEDPQSRIEKWLKYIAENGGGGDVPSEAIAPAYDETKTYSVGDLAWKDETLKVFDGTNWSETSVSELVGDLEDSIHDTAQAVDTIESKIPAQATESNKLADKEFVNSSIATNTAHYIYKTVGANKVPFDSVSELEAYTGAVTPNDYAFVTGTDASGNAYYDRYKATVNGTTVTWAKEYRLNNSSFTAEQWSAISSGITSGDVAVIRALEDMDFVEIVKLQDGTETLASIRNRIDAINAAGKHVFFDTSVLAYPLYLCTIAIEYDENDQPSTYRLNDLVSGRTSIGEYDATLTLSDILENSFSSINTLTVICQTQDGVTVTGQTVTVRNGSTKDAPIIATKAYNGQPVTFVLAVNTPYFVSVSDSLEMHFNPTTSSGVLATDATVILTYSDLQNLTRISDIPAALAIAATSESVKAALVGKEFDDTWTDTAANTEYNIKWIITGTANAYTDDDGYEHIITANDPLPSDKTSHLLCKFNWKWCTPFNVQFDAKEQVAVSSGTFSDDLYYYRKNVDESFTELVKGTDYQVGDAITETLYINELHNAKDAVRYGYNRFSHSQAYQWLNSDALKGQWQELKHTGDVLGDISATKDGFKRGCSQEILNTISPIKLAVALNTVTDSALGSFEFVPCEFFLPSLEEMYGVPQLANVEGPYMPYWKRATDLDEPNNAANDGRKIYAVNAQSSPQICWLSSDTRGYSYSQWLCSSSGQLYSYAGAGYSCRLAPDCVIVQSE